MKNAEKRLALLPAIGKRVTVHLTPESKINNGRPIQSFDVADVGEDRLYNAARTWVPIDEIAKITWQETATLDLTEFAEEVASA
jgi:hypothetical protein